MKIVFLLSLLTIVFCRQKINKYDTIKFLQDAFDDVFCGGCGDENITCHNNRLNVENLTGYKLTKRPIINNTIGLIGVQFTTVSSASYFTFPNGLKNRTMDVKSLLAIPIFNTSSPYRSLRGIVVYFHPTIFDRSTVPSSMRLYYKVIAALYASEGYGVVFPDYPGFNANEIHPYVLYPQQNVQSGIIGAVEMSLEIKEWPTYDPDVKKPLFSAGYSEGAAYSIWLSKCMRLDYKCEYMNANRTQITEFYVPKIYAGLDGAYDLGGIVRSFLIGRVEKGNGNKYQIERTGITAAAKPNLISLTLLGFSEYAKLNASDTFKSMFNPEFYKCAFCYVDGAHYDLEKVLKLPNANQTELLLGITASAEGKSMNGETYGPVESENSVLALVKESIINGIPFNKALDDADLLTYNNSNLYVFTLNLDSAVSPNNTRNFIRFKTGIPYHYFPNDKYQVCNGKGEVNVDHIKGELIGNIYALMQFTYVSEPEISYENEEVSFDLRNEWNF